MRPCTNGASTALALTSAPVAASASVFTAAVPAIGSAPASERPEGGSWGQPCSHGLWQLEQNHPSQPGHGMVESVALPH